MGNFLNKWINIHLVPFNVTRVFKSILKMYKDRDFLINERKLEKSVF